MNAQIYFYTTLSRYPIDSEKQFNYRSVYPPIEARAIRGYLPVDRFAAIGEEKAREERNGEQSTLDRSRSDAIRVVEPIWIGRSMSLGLYLDYGSQREAAGPVNSSLVAVALNSLRQWAPPSIAFKECEATVISGGVCSVMSLSFGTRYLLKTQTRRGAPNQLCELLFPKLMKHYRQASCPMRSIQLAMNQIHYASASDSSDFPPALEELRLAKIQALAASYFLTATPIGGLLGIDESDIDSIEEQIETAGEGVYLARILAENDSDKGEAYGHTMIYIYRKEGRFLYNPNDGVLNIQNGMGKTIVMISLSLKRGWPLLNSLSLYRLKRAADAPRYKSQYEFLTLEAKL